jgi:hypothetical protein
LGEKEEKIAKYTKQMCGEGTGRKNQLKSPINKYKWDEQLCTLILIMKAKRKQWLT